MAALIAADAHSGRAAAVAAVGLRVSPGRAAPPQSVGASAPRPPMLSRIAARSCSSSSPSPFLSKRFSVSSRLRRGPPRLPRRHGGAHGFALALVELAVAVLIELLHHFLRTEPRPGAAFARGPRRPWPGACASRSVRSSCPSASFFGGSRVVQQALGVAPARGSPGSAAVGEPGRPAASGPPVPVASGLRRLAWALAKLFVPPSGLARRPAARPSWWRPWLSRRRPERRLPGLSLGCRTVERAGRDRLL